MRYSLIHCYSDFNKGDAAIILSTIDLIRKFDKDSEINLMSTYASYDKRIETEHYLTKINADNLSCSFFPEPYISLDGKTEEISNFLKFLNFLKYFTKGLFLFLIPYKKFYKLFYNKIEIESLDNFMSSDIIISKGGSFLYSFKGLRGLFFFLRMIFPLLLSIRVNKKTIIYSQSIGPLENKISQIIFKYIAPKFTKIYLREKVCLSLFDELGITLDNVEVIPDSAFYLNIEKEEDKEMAIFKNQNFKVGITARPHEFRSSNQDELYENYIDSLVYNISWLVQEKNSTVYLFPQVIGPAAIENDLLALNYIYEKLDDNVKKSVVYLKNDYSPRELKKLYSHMDIFIATRLHSAIFAMSSGVPTINISYHGTKSKGIMGMVGLENYIIDIDKITNDDLQEKINNIIKNKTDIKNKLLNEMEKLNKELENSISKVITSNIDNMMN